MNKRHNLNEDKIIKDNLIFSGMKLLLVIHIKRILTT